MLHMLGKSDTSEEKYGARGMTNFIALRQSAFKAIGSWIYRCFNMGLLNF